MGELIDLGARRRPKPHDRRRDWLSKVAERAERRLASADPARLGPAARILVDNPRHIRP